MPIGPGQSGHTFDYGTIVSYAPNQSGVYAIYSQNAWIYFGEGQDIRARLLAHLNGDNTCITRCGPTGFQFELWAAHQLVARQDQLIARLGSLCNVRFG
jgi:GIY-YIG catalytic domain